VQVAHDVDVQTMEAEADLRCLPLLEAQMSGGRRQRWWGVEEEGAQLRAEAVTSLYLSPRAKVRKASGRPRRAAAAAQLPRAERGRQLALLHSTRQERCSDGRVGWRSGRGGAVLAGGRH
jgi:hypothetical protein